LPSKSELGIPENTFLIIIQGAGINVDRGSEEAIEAMKMIENACLMIVGDGDVVGEGEVVGVGVGVVVPVFEVLPFVDFGHACTRQ
jgi:hypothetical protein